MKQTKEIYVSPEIEVIEVENEGVIASSNLSDMNVIDWGATPKTSKMHNSYNSAGSSDLEDMINDILTVGE